MAAGIAVTRGLGDGLSQAAGYLPVAVELGFGDLTRHVIISAATGVAYAVLTAPLLVQKWASLGLSSDRKR